MSYSSSSSAVQRRQPGPPPPLRTSMHALLGGGNVADILLWEKKHVSATILIGFTLIWFLLEVVEYTFVTLLCHISILAMAFLFVWSTASGFLESWSPPDSKALAISESTFRWLFGKINNFLLTFYEVSSGSDFKRFILAITVLWLLSIIGNFFNFLNLIYAGFLCMATLPVIYERYHTEVDRLASRGFQDLKRLYKKSGVEAKFSKIPKGPVKDRKIY
ncbi:unnamed protein product [Cuscuta europaea]|uniref:Reticulon-like protein n=1 Tax=Cuscuta europaea TaxID=41803 RepID=A0A9P0ZQ33_CUSEU|nr:unnamed protein product [Cuscuta europaea]